MDVIVKTWQSGSCYIAIVKHWLVNSYVSLLTYFSWKSIHVCHYRKVHPINILRKTVTFIFFGFQFCDRILSWYWVPIFFLSIAEVLDFASYCLAISIRHLSNGTEICNWILKLPSNKCLAAHKKSKAHFSNPNTTPFPRSNLERVKRANFELTFFFLQSESSKSRDCKSNCKM